MYEIHIPAGVKVLREKGNKMVTLSGDVYVEANREADGAFVYTVDGNRYCCSAGCCNWTAPKYNKEAVDKAIKRDPRIKGHEAKLIHRLLKGRAR